MTPVQLPQSVPEKNTSVSANKPASANARTTSNDRVEGLRVLHVAAPATGSGAYWMVDILRGLKRLGYEVSGLINSTHGDLAPNLRRAGIPYYVLDLDLFSNPITAPNKLLKLTRFLRKHKFDIVHYHLFPSMISGRIGSWLADVPLRYSMITGPLHLEAPASSKIDIRTQWMDTKLIASCEYTRELYYKMGISKNRIERVYYGPDESRFDPEAADRMKVTHELGIHPGTPIVGMIAIFYPPLPRGSAWTPHYLQGRAIKAHETLIQAARIILEKHPRVKFLLVGGVWDSDGQQYLAHLKEAVKGMGLSKAVIFTGHRSDIPDVLASLDVSVQCSLSENLGGTIESLLMAKPTVATAVGGMTDTVIDQHTGILVPPGDARKLAEAIMKLLDDKKKARQFGQNGRELMLRNFTLTKTVEDIDRLYQSSAHRMLNQKENNSLTADHYRLYRTLLNLCALTVLLPITFRSAAVDMPKLVQRILGRH